MKRISLKLKLTLLYTFFMAMLTCAALAILFSLTNREILSSTQSRLERRVQESVEDLDYDDGKLEVDSDIYSVTRDIYLSLYDSDMYFLYGRVPQGFDQQPELADGVTRTIREGNHSWYVYDLSFPLAPDYTIYVRGITSVTDAEASFTVTLRFALILLPLMVLATAVIGYCFTKRPRFPVRQITSTVREIRADAALSRRIGLTEQSGESDKNPTNMDEIYTLAATFDDMLGELEKVFDREKQFTSDVSHELRTPVGVILAQCESMLRDSSLSEAQQADVRLIERKAKSMADMISQLLFLSRADQGTQPLNREVIDLSGLTEMTVEEGQMLADSQGRGIRIEAEIEPEIEAWADETLYIRMLVNLISNAVRYSYDNGVVEVSLSTEGEDVCGAVRDHGQGIPADALPHIWERFYQADSSRTDGSHSGLGLSMVKWIAEAHGGSVSVVSREGEGSIFTFRLPASEMGTGCGTGATAGGQPGG